MHRSYISLVDKFTLNMPRVAHRDKSLEIIINTLMKAKKTTKTVAKKAAKKTAKKATKKVAKKAVKKVAKKAAKKAVKKVAKKAAKKAAKKTTKKAAKKVTRKVTNEDLCKAAYLIYENRIKNGIPGNEKTDWLAAETKLKNS